MVRRAHHERIASIFEQDALSLVPLRLDPVYPELVEGFVDKSLFIDRIHDLESSALLCNRAVIR